MRTQVVENKTKFLTGEALQRVDSHFRARLNRTRYQSASQAEHFGETQQVQLMDKSLCSDRRRCARRCSEVQQLQFIDKVTKNPCLGAEADPSGSNAFRDSAVQALQRTGAVLARGCWHARCCCQGDESQTKTTALL